MKVTGFIRIVPTYPAPVVPVFSDSEFASTLFVQIVNEDGQIVGFGEVDGLPGQRLMLRSHPSYPDAQVGEEAIFAMEVAEHDVSLRRLSKYPEFLRRLSTEGRLAAHPFLELEVASALSDADMYKAAAMRCMTNLAGRSHDLAEAWVRGSISDAGLSADLMSQLASFGSDGPPRT